MSRLAVCCIKSLCHHLNQSCWIPALVVDGYPEVQHAARLALTPSLAFPEVVGNSTPDNGLGQAAGLIPSSPSAAAHAGAASSFPVTAAAAAMRGACEVLRAAALSTLTVEPEAGGVADTRTVDLAEEETTRTALRALRGGSSLLGSPRVERDLPHLASSTAQPGQREEEKGNKQDATAARVEALESVEALLVGTLPDLPDLSVPWAAEGGDRHGAAASAGSAAGVGGLSLEAGKTVRAVSLGGVECSTVFRAKALGAATAAVEEFRSECLLAAGGGGGREAGDEGGEGLWKRVYCGLLVRLEACSAFMVGPEPPSPLPAREGVVVGGQDGDNTSAAVAAAPAQAPVAGEGAGGITVGGEPATAPAARGSPPSSLTPLAEGLVEALEEVPFAYEQAVPPNLDNDDGMTTSEKNALRARGGRRRRWMVASAHLLLRAGAKLCEQCSRSSGGGGAPVEAVAGVNGSGGEETLASTTLVKLLVAALPFQQAATEADDPTEALQSCMRPPQDNPGLDPAGAATPSAVSELTAPIPWEPCVHGRALPTHALSAPWASHAATVELAKRLVDVAWSALYLGGGDDGGIGSSTSAAEALMRALRVATRARGGWRDDAGVGIKHAASAAIRRLCSPLFSGAALGHALPLVLPLADDYDPAHQAVGFSLLLRVFAEAPPAELGWHRGLLLEVLERGIRCGGREPSSSALCVAAVVRLLQRAPKDGGGGERDGIRIAREALAQAARATDGAVKAVMVCGAAALLEVPTTGEGYAPCEFLRPALLCLLPILQVCSMHTCAHPPLF